MPRKKRAQTEVVETEASQSEEALSDLDSEEVDEDGKFTESVAANEDAVSDDETTGVLPLPTTESSEEVDPTPKRARRARSRKEPQTIDLAACDASANVDKNAVKHWESVRAITDAIAKNFEKISQQLQEISLHSPQSPAIIERHGSPKVTLLNRIAIAASAASLIVGFVGLSLSQSVKEQLLRSRSMEPASAQANLESERRESAPTMIIPTAPTDTFSKKPSDLTRRQKELWWRSRRGN